MATTKTKSLTKAQIIEYMSKKTGLAKKDVKQFFEEFNQLAYKQAKKGFTIPGIGKLITDRRKARIGRNPQTGEAIKIAAKKVVKFRVAKACKDAVIGAAPTGSTGTRIKKKK